MDVQTDFLVIGSGVAGLNFALRVARIGRVALVTKKEAMDSNTNLAQGGIAAVLGGGRFLYPPRSGHAGIRCRAVQ